MSQNYFVRHGADTTVVEADDYQDAASTAADEFSFEASYEIDPQSMDDVVELDEGDFNELFTDVHVTVDSEGEWTGSLTVETNDDSEYSRETLFELERVDELGLFGAYFSGEMHGTFEKNNVTVYVRGGVHDGERGGSVYVVESHRDL